MNERNYRNDPALSQSQLKVLGESVPLFYHRYVARTIPDEPPTADMQIGTALHAMVFEPDTFEDTVVVGLDIDRRSKANKEAWSEFEEIHAGKIILKPDVYEQVREMAQSVLSCSWFQQNVCNDRSFIDRSGIEKSVFWCDHETGIDLKGRLDFVNEGFIVDVKTTTGTKLTPDEITRTIFRYGYHFQAAMYSWGYSTFSDLEEWPEFFQVLVSKSKPYEVAVFRFSDDLINQGISEIEELLGELQRCFRSDSWEGRYAVHPGLISLPGWKKQNT